METYWRSGGVAPRPEAICSLLNLIILTTVKTYKSHSYYDEVFSGYQTGQMVEQ
jgi:hypothetical protein